MKSSDLFSLDENGQPEDKWIFDELLGADDLPDPDAIDLADESGEPVEPPHGESDE